MLLESLGFSVQTHASPEAFLADPSAAQSDCIITDIRMPGLSGFDLMARLKRQGVAVPVIVVSAYDDDFNRQHSGQLGAKAFLRKPVDDQVLINAIHQAIGSSHPITTANH